MLRIIRQLLVSATFVISTMTYMRASMEELSDEAQSSQSIAYLALLALFAGVCESLEIYDHLFPEESLDTHDDTSAAPETKASSKTIGKSALVIGGVATLAPSLILCAWAHKLQGDALAHTLGIEEKFWGLVLATPALTKFCAVSIPHLLHTLNGTRERYSLSVTNNEVEKLPKNSMPPLRWWVMLAVLVYLHLPEGRLIASPIREGLLKHLAAFGFSLAESIPHLNQLEQLPQNIASMLTGRQNYSLSSLALRLSAGIVGGLGSASEAMIAAFVGNRSKATAWIAPLVEFVLGFAETQQHLVPSVQKLLQHSIFGSLKKATEKPEADTRLCRKSI